jgi:hypothetical protein
MCCPSCLGDDGGCDLCEGTGDLDWFEPDVDQDMFEHSFDAAVAQEWPDSFLAIASDRSCHDDYN